MRTGNLEKIVRAVFTHAGIIRGIHKTLESETVAHVKVTWVPWLALELEDVTSMLLESDMIVDDSYLYMRAKNTDSEITANITVDFGEEHWKRELAKQLSCILAQEIRNSVTCDA